ncbi:MAG TPA: hypothetical protein VLV83_09355 [Acidobacteriota bacterium]|nr:hypothetical protein [Acidobacteriota bacterium]
MKLTASKLRKRRRTLDYVILVLSLAGLLTVYEMVVGCAGALDPAAKFQVLDGNEKDGLGRVELTPQDSCTTIQVSNEIALNNVVACEECGNITWTAQPTQFADVTLGSTGAFTAAQICRTGVVPSLGRASVILVGTYTKRLSEDITQELTIVRRVPLRIPEPDAS